MLLLWKSLTGNGIVGTAKLTPRNVRSCLVSSASRCLPDKFRLFPSRSVVRVAEEEKEKKGAEWPHWKVSLKKEKQLKVNDILFKTASSGQRQCPDSAALTSPCRFRRHVFEGSQLQQHQPRPADGAAAENRGEHREDKGVQGLR